MAGNSLRKSFRVFKELLTLQFFNGLLVPDLACYIAILKVGILPFPITRYLGYDSLFHSVVAVIRVHVWRVNLHHNLDRMIGRSTARRARWQTVYLFGRVHADVDRLQLFDKSRVFLLFSHRLEFL